MASKDDDEGNKEARRGGSRPASRDHAQRVPLLRVLTAPPLAHDFPQLAHSPTFLLRNQSSLISLPYLNSLLGQSV